MPPPQDTDFDVNSTIATALAGGPSRRINFEGSLTDDQQARHPSNIPRPAPPSPYFPSTLLAWTTTTNAASRPTLVRPNSSSSSMSSYTPGVAGSATASTWKHLDKRAGAAANSSSPSSSHSSSSAYRPICLPLDQLHSLKSTISTSSVHRVYHNDQASPISPSSSKESVVDLHCHGTYLLPCPPTSPLSRRRRFSLKEYHSNLSRVFGWARDRMYVVRSTLGMTRSAHQTHRPNASKHVPSNISQRSLSPAVWVVLYFTLNLSLTLYNKYVLIHFPFPYTLTALHALCGTIGTSIMLHLGRSRKEAAVPMGEKALASKGTGSAIPNLTMKETAVVLLFSLLYTVNIVVSNASLKLVTVPFHQVIRGSTPLFTIALSAILFNKRCSRAKLIALIPVIAGVGFATYGDYYCTLFGFCLTLFGTILAAFKTVVTHFFLCSPADHTFKRRLSDGPADESTNRHRRVPSIFKYVGGRMRPVSTSSITSLSLSSVAEALRNLDLPKLSLTPLQLLYLMSPLAFIQTTLLAHFTGELAAVNRHLHFAGMSASVSAADSQGFLGWGFGLGAFGGLGRMGLGALGAGMPSGWLIMNGVMAFALNVVSFYANKKIGAVGMSVAANVKQVLTVLCAVVMFDLTITMANGVGIVLTLVGGAWYAQLEMNESRQGMEKESKRSG